MHRLVADEVGRLRVELEMPAPDGKFPTNLEDYIEKVGKPTRSDGSVFYAADATQGLLQSQADAQALLDKLAAELASLPRISRQFNAILLSRAEERQTFGGRGRRINADLVGRLSSLGIRAVTSPIGSSAGSAPHQPYGRQSWPARLGEPKRFPAGMRIIPGIYAWIGLSGREAY